MFQLVSCLLISVALAPAADAQVAARGGAKNLRPLRGDDMALTRWLGTTDTDWEVSGNWDNGVPSADDDVVISADAIRGLLVNVDRTGDTAGAGLDLDSFTIEKGFAYNVGSSGTPLILTCDKVEALHPGELYFNSANGTGSTVTDLLILNGSGYYVITHQTDGAITATDALGGTIDITYTGGVDPSRLLFVDPELPVDLKYIEAGASVSGLTIYMAGGKVEYQNAAGTTSYNVFMSAGEFVWSSGLLIGTLVQNGGIFYFDAGATITTARLLGGVFDATRTIDSQTIGVVRSSQVDFRADANLLTITDRIIGD
jgi:hypothetical protein